MLTDGRFDDEWVNWKMGGPIYKLCLKKESLSCELSCAKEELREKIRVWCNWNWRAWSSGQKFGFAIFWPQGFVLWSLKDRQFKRLSYTKWCRDRNGFKNLAFWHDKNAKYIKLQQMACKYPNFLLQCKVSFIWLGL